MDEPSEFVPSSSARPDDGLLSGLPPGRQRVVNPRPTLLRLLPEAQKVKNHLCFCDEKVELEVDG